MFTEQETLVLAEQYNTCQQTSYLTGILVILHMIDTPAGKDKTSSKDYFSLAQNKSDSWHHGNGQSMTQNSYVSKLEPKPETKTSSNMRKTGVFKKYLCWQY
jgi:hypothetical protein